MESPIERIENQPTLFEHLLNIIVLPFTVTVIVPFLVYPDQVSYIRESTFLKVIGVVIFFMGLVLFSYTVYLFGRIGRGTLAPWSPPKRLVVKGPYLYCRNPMISGIFFMLLGEACVLHSVNIFLWAALVFIINTIYFIFVEEVALQKRFGEEYARYKSAVPMWIPKTKPYHP